MSESDPLLGTKHIDPQLAEEAAAQMRRPFPGQEPVSKRRKVTSKAEEADDAPVPVLTRFAYNAGDLLKKGARGLLMTCHMRHERGAAKETLAAMQDYGFADSLFSTVKVACQGLVVILLNEPGAQPSPPTDKEQAPVQEGATESQFAGPAANEPLPPFHLTVAVQKFIQDVGSKKRAATKVVQRVMPMEFTSVLDPAELRKQMPLLVASFKASPLATKFEAMHAEGHNIPFAVGFKNRDFDTNGCTWNGTMDGPTWEVYDRTTSGTTKLQQQAPSADATKEQRDDKPLPAAAAPGGEAAGDGAKAASEAAGEPGQAPQAANSGTDGKAKPAVAANTAAALRQSVIHVLATSLQAALAPWQLSVSLSQPDLVLLCEVIPMAGGTAFAGLGLVPADLCKIKSTIALQPVWVGR